MIALVLRSMASGQTPSPELKRAQAELDRLITESRQVIKVMTAEQALRAQKVVREAGRRR